MIPGNGFDADLLGVAAAAELLVDEPNDLVSPELALVDAALSARLREDLRDPEDCLSRPPSLVVEEEPVELDLPVDEPADVVLEPVELAHEEHPAENVDEQPDYLDYPVPVEIAHEEHPDEIVEEAPDYPVFEPAELAHEEHPAEIVDERPDYLVIEPVDEEVAEAAATSSLPVLPAPPPGEPDRTLVTEEALRQIRERLTVQPTPRKRTRFRRGFGFGIASGASTVCALAVLALDTRFGLT